MAYARLADPSLPNDLRTLSVTVDLDGVRAAVAVVVAPDLQKRSAAVEPTRLLRDAITIRVDRLGPQVAPTQPVLNVRRPDADTNQHGARHRGQLRRILATIHWRRSTIRVPRHIRRRVPRHVPTVDANTGALLGVVVAPAIAVVVDARRI